MKRSVNFRRKSRRVTAGDIIHTLRRLGASDEQIKLAVQDQDRVCENCGEPMKYHVGGVERGLCKNKPEPQS